MCNTVKVHLVYLFSASYVQYCESVFGVFKYFLFLVCKTIKLQDGVFRFFLFLMFDTLKVCLV